MAWKKAIGFLLFINLCACVCAFSSPISKSEERTEKTVTVYFPNWNVYQSDDGQVKDLPWDQVNCVNHAFWKVSPAENGFKIVSTDPFADMDATNPKAHFPQYAQYAKKYPGVDILLSIGGWTCSGQFSQMALTRESRRFFIQSCLDTLNQYPFFTGIDIDWEYPGEARKGDGKGDEGNPVKGNDKENFTLLLKELRQALDESYGKNKKKLTICAAGAVSILKKQDYAALHPYVTRINLMTYDLYNRYSPTTGHHAALYGDLSADTAVCYLRKQGVPAEKIAIGSPFYGHGWKIQDLSKGVLIGAPAVALNEENMKWRYLSTLEAAACGKEEPGWHMGYDEAAEAAYLWNDDPASKDYGACISYESARSLAAKMRYIKDNRLGGIIVWEVGGDDAKKGYPLCTLMREMAP